MALLIDIKFPQGMTGDELREEVLCRYPGTDTCIDADPGESLRNLNNREQGY